MANYKKTQLVKEKSKMNPFEVHINKQKMAILGQKTSNDRGLPGISRAKALTKRKQTILQEFKLQHKSNQFMDRRIGERSRDLQGEDKVIARFAAIRKKAHKKSIYNLSTDHFLTHKGQNLAEIEKFDDPRSEEEYSEGEEDASSGLLGSKFVSDAHFGGGILKKTQIEGAKSHRDLIDELIAESKKRKAEKQKTKEATLELTEKLDSEWKDLFPLINQKNTNDEDIKPIQTVTEQARSLDDYDKVMRELRFEERGTVSDRLKTEEEKKNEEKESLRALEEERAMRMKDYEKANKATTHRSADDLEDDFVYTDDLLNEEVALSYNEAGEANLEIDVEFNNPKKNFCSDDDKNIELDDDNSNDSEIDGNQVELSDDNFSDLDVDSEDSENGSTLEETEIMQEPKNDRIISDNNTSVLPDLTACSTIPDSYDSFRKQLENCSAVDQNIIITNIMKQNLLHAEKNKLRQLFGYLLQYLDDCANCRAEKSFEVFSVLAPHLFELSQVDKENSYFSLKRLIEETHDDYKKRPKKYPHLKVLLFLKLVGLLFPTSDFRHQVVTPCLVFMEQMLWNCKVKSQRDVSFGLFLVTLIAEYTTLSRRYFPASVRFLGGLLHMAIPKVSVKLVKVNSPFQPTSNFLVLSKNCSKIDIDLTQLKMRFDDLTENNATVDNLFKIRVIFTTVRLIRDFDRNFFDLPSNVEIFHDIVAYLDLIPFSHYPKLVKNELENILQQLNRRRNERSISYIVSTQQKPKSLRLYEPKVEQIFDGKKRKNLPREKLEREKLLHKLKKETKGALREIRRDKAFLGRVKIQQRLKGDRDRRDKVKQIYSEAAMQQSELNSLKRKKTK